MSKKWIDPITFKGLKKESLYFRNFKGINKFNPKDHKRTFGIKLDPVLAESLEDKGWYIRWSKVKEEYKDEVDPIPYLQVTLKFDGYKPSQVNMLTGKGRRKKIVALDEGSVAVLDSADIEKMTVEIRPYVWDETGKYGAAAILSGANVYCKQDELEAEREEYMEEDDEDDEDAPF